MQGFFNILHRLCVMSIGVCLVLFLVLAACAPLPQTQTIQSTLPPKPETVAPPPQQNHSKTVLTPTELPPAFPDQPPAIEETALPPTQAQKTRVALLLPLSGKASEAGQALMNAAQLALFDHATEDFELIVRDTIGQPDMARRVAEDVIGEGAEIIIGPLFGQSVIAMTPLAQDAGVPVITFSNDTTIARNGVYPLGLTPEQQINRLVSYAGGQGITRFALLAPANEFGQRLSGAMSEATRKNGSALVKSAFYTPGAQDQRTTIKTLANYDQRNAELKAHRKALQAEGTAAAKRALKRLKGRDTLRPPDFDAILVGASGLDLLTLAPLLNFYDVDPRRVRYLGTAQWDNPRLGREPTLTESWFTNYSPKNWAAFAARYRQTYNSNAPRLAALAYDAVAMAAIMARTAENNPFDRTTLTRTSGFDGINGYFRLNTGGRVERALPILTLKRDAVTLREEATLPAAN